MLPETGLVVLNNAFNKRLLNKALYTKIRSCAHFDKKLIYTDT